MSEIRTETMTAAEYQQLFGKGNKANPHVPTKKKGNGDKAKWEMEVMLRLAGLEYQTEFMFHPERKWRADFAVPNLKCLIEYEGLFSEKSRHTTINGFIGDCEKYRSAAILGWKVLRYTNKDYTKMSEDINEILKQNA